MKLDSLDRKLLNLLQAEFPLTGEPYAELGQQTGLDTEEVMQRISRLKEKGIIRMISPVMDPGSLGYRTTLAAMKVAKADLEKAQKVIAGHPGVSHGYEREHRFNVWFTLALPPAADIDTELENLSRAAGAEAAFSLPAIKVFKLAAYFAIDDDGQNAPASHRGAVHPAGRVELSSTERLLINALQQDLPLVPAPFTAMAGHAGISVEQFLAGCRALQQRGVIRRFSAMVNHNHIGFTANAMTCWSCPPEITDIAGQKLASLKEVSHCYERETNPLWQYNLFAMIHGRSREACETIADNVSSETGLTDCVVLYSTREFKKTRVKYQV